MTGKNERIYIVSIQNKPKHLDVVFRRNGKELRAISKSFQYFKDRENTYIWAFVEQAQIGGFVLSEGKAFTGGDLSVDQRIQVLAQAVFLTAEFIKKDQSCGPQRASGLVNRFYENACNAVSGDISIPSESQNENKRDVEVSPVGESIAIGGKVE